MPRPVASSSGIWQQLCNLPPPVLRNGARELDVKVNDHVPFLARLLGDGHALQESAKGVAAWSTRLHRMEQMLLQGSPVLGCCCSLGWQERGGGLNTSSSWHWACPAGCNHPHGSLPQQTLHLCLMQLGWKQCQGGVGPAPQCATATTSAAPRGWSATCTDLCGETGHNQLQIPMQ